MIHTPWVAINVVSSVAPTSSTVQQKTLTAAGDLLAKQLGEAMDDALGLDGNRLGAQSPLSPSLENGRDRSRSTPEELGVREA